LVSKNNREHALACFLFLIWEAFNTAAVCAKCLKAQYAPPRCFATARSRRRSKLLSRYNL